MKVHLNKKSRAEQLKVLKHGMRRRAEELKYLGESGTVTLHWYDENTVEIYPLLDEDVQEDILFNRIPRNKSAEAEGKPGSAEGRALTDPLPFLSDTQNSYTDKTQD